MGTSISRRTFSKLLLSGAAAGSALLMPGTSVFASGATSRVVVIGGGFGGATVAKYLKMGDPELSVTLVEPKTVFHTCPMSNSVIGGLQTMSFIAQRYDTLAKQYGVELVHDYAISVDPVNRMVRLKGGRSVGYDRLVVSVGVDFIWDSIEGYSQQAANSLIPHAYEAGPQTELLRRQLLSMKDGDNVLIVPPNNPFRCPAAPYERASIIAHYLKRHKPKSKIIILDDKEVFTKQDLFMLGWDRLYPGMIEWRSGSFGGHVERIDPAAMTVSTEFGDEKAGVINVIPPQRAGRIAFEAGLVDESGWCPVDETTFESLKQPGIHVIGDSALVGPMPKSGVSANTQAKALAAWLISSFGGRLTDTPELASLCYSLIGPGYAVSVSGSYVQGSGGIENKPDSVHLTSMEASSQQLAEEATQSEQWYHAITQDIWH